MTTVVVRGRLLEDPMENPEAALLDPAVDALAFRMQRGLSPMTLTLSEQIAARIGDRIVADAYEPGTWLTGQALAAEFGVSLSPVREALRILEHEGLVQFHPRRGTQVTKLTADELRDIFEIRAGLFRMASERLARERPPQHIAVMEKGVALLEEYAVDPDAGHNYAVTVYKLSLFSVRATGNRRLEEIVTSLSVQTLRYSRTSLAGHERRKASVKLWREAVDAMKNGDIQRAGELSVIRILASRDEALRVLEEQERAEETACGEER